MWHMILKKNLVIIELKVQVDHFILLSLDLIIITQQQNKKKLLIQVPCNTKSKIHLEEKHRLQMNNFQWVWVETK